MYINIVEETKKIEEIDINNYKCKIFDSNLWIGDNRIVLDDSSQRLYTAIPLSFELDGAISRTKIVEAVLIKLHERNACGIYKITYDTEHVSVEYFKGD